MIDPTLIRRRSLFCAGAVLIATSSALAQAGTGAAPDPATNPAPDPAAQPAPDDASQLTASESPWRFDIYTWIWLMGVDGELGVRGRASDVSASFGDILDNSDSIFAFSGRLELGYGRFAGFVDGMYADIGADDQSGRRGLASVDVELEQTIVDFGLMYRIGDWEPTGNAAGNPRNLTIDLYAGARYSGLDLELRPANDSDRSGSKDWIDPIVGAKAVIPIAERWHLMINGDVGGFGVNSDFTWSATAVVGYGFHLFDRPASVMLGYRAIGWDYSDGSGDEEFTFDAIMHGAILGFSLHF